MYTHYDGAVSIFHRTSASVNSRDGQSLPKEKLYDTLFVLIYGTQLTFGVYVKISVFSWSFLEYSSLQWFFSTDIHRLSGCKTKRLLWGFFHKVMKTQGIKSLKEQIQLLPEWQKESGIFHWTGWDTEQLFWWILIPYMGIYKCMTIAIDILNYIQNFSILCDH